MTIHAGQVHVQQYQVHHFRAQYLQGLFTAEGRYYLVPISAQYILHALIVIYVVLNHQNRGAFVVQETNLLVPGACCVLRMAINAQPVSADPTGNLTEVFPLWYHALRFVDVRSALL